MPNSKIKNLSASIRQKLLNLAQERNDAILDRLLHHSTTINIRGESYRLKVRRKGGLVPPREQERAAFHSLASDAVEPSAVFWRVLGGTEAEAKEAHS